MAQQQAMLFDTITAMKKAVARTDDASESDDSIEHPTNRGNKLKRKAKFVQEGRLSQADGPRVYKRKLDYNGYSRQVISKNPPRVDPDGDIIEDEHDSDLDLSAAEEDPYADVKLEKLLMPLTSAAALDKHPSLSAHYTSKILEEMVQNAQDLVHREQASLYRMNQLLVQFRGDNTWAPCGTFEVEEDATLLRDMRRNMLTPASANPESVAPVAASAPAPANWETMSNVRLVADLENAADDDAMEDRVSAEEQEEEESPDISQAPRIPEAEARRARNDLPAISAARSIPNPVAANSDIRMSDLEPPIDPTAVTEHVVPQTEAGEAVLTETATRPEPPKERNPNSQPGTASVSSESMQQLQSITTANGTHSGLVDLNETTSGGELASNHIDLTTNHNTQGAHPPPSDPVVIDLEGQGEGDAEDQNSEADSATQPHRMTTRARAQAHPSPPPTDSNTPRQPADAIPIVHSFFIPPSPSIPDPTSSLPTPLAEDVRRALSAYTQKQYEVVRQANDLLQGLRKALRLKRTVWSWCRNEGHVGEMSDGEDWIDADEWGLDEPLRKGEEVEDEDVGVSIGKKTRNRRQVA